MWKEEKDTIIAWTIFFIIFFIGDGLWISAEGDLRDIGIIITTLSVVGIIIWSVKKDRSERK